MKAVCVYCAAQLGARPSYAKAARATGEAIARAGLTLIYGGGRSGLMGILADAALSAGGAVVGVMPADLVSKEIAHRGLTQLHVVNSMHERKWKLAELADAFLTLPGGAGTLEEFTEQWTWAQLGFHAKPSALLNVEGYFEPLRATIARMVEEGFLLPRYADMLIVEDRVEVVLEAFGHYVPPPSRWADSGGEPRP
jgi:uncharacterized protein (TIGR00730 family)